MSNENNEFTFAQLIDSYIEERPELQKNTVRNYAALKQKLFHWGNKSGLSQNIFDYDILAVKNPMERAAKISQFKSFWNKFRESLEKDYSLSPQTRNQYRTVMASILNHAENNFGVMIKMPEKEKAPKYKDRKRELPESVVTYLFGLSPAHHWAVNVAKLALYTCWRVGDLVEIEADDLTLGDFLGERVYFITRQTQKTGKIMKTPVPVSLINDMMRRNNVAPGNKLVKYPKNTMHGLPKKIKPREVAEQMRSLFNSTQFLRDQKVEVVNTAGQMVTKPLWQIERPMHLLRSAGASYLIARGLTPSAVAKWFTGHEAAQVLTDHYITTEDFTGSKELFRDRFAVTHIKNADKAMAIFDKDFSNEEE